MKNRVLIFLVLLSIHLSLKCQQWSSLNTGFNYFYHNSDCIGIDTVVAAGYDSNNEGKIIVSYSGGLSFTDLDLPTGVPQLYAVRFVDANTGYAAGQNGTLIKTTDAGSNWNYLTTNTSAQLTSIWFIDKDTGYVSGSNGVLLKTTNAGSSWTPLITGTTMVIQSVCFPEAKTGYLCAYGNPLASGIILKSTDYGNTWSAQTTPLFGSLNIRGRKVYFANPDTGMCVGLNGAILQTKDGGQNWVIKGSGVTTQNLNGLTLASGGNFLICGNTGTIIKAPAFGDSLVNQTISTTLDYYTVSACEDSSAYIFGINGSGLKAENVFPGIRENEKKLFANIFPNPSADNVVTIKSNSEISSIKLTTLTGDVIAHEYVNSKKEYSLKKELNRGLYLLTIEAVSGENLTKLIQRQ